MKKTAGSPGVDYHTPAFLEALAAGGGKPLEQFPPSGAPCPSQCSSESSPGHRIALTMVCPAGFTMPLPMFLFVFPQWNLR